MVNNNDIKLYKISTVWDSVFCIFILGQNEGHKELQAYTLYFRLPNASVY